MRPQELQLNRIAQGLVDEDTGLRWFATASTEERIRVLQYLAHMAHQAQPRSEDVSVAIARSGLRPTFTACVMLQSSDRPTQVLSRIAVLPEAEQVKSFRLLMALFSVADTRRRETHCKNGCTHEWHNLGAL